MLKTIWGPDMTLREEELLRRERRNRKYMMDLKSENLVLNFQLEAGRFTTPYLPEGIHGGWEAQTCQLRGHFLGHWLSAAAMRYHAAGDGEPCISSLKIGFTRVESGSATASLPLSPKFKDRFWGIQSGADAWHEKKFERGVFCKLL